MWQELAIVLGRLVDQYRKLKKLNEEKQAVLAMFQLQELEKITQRENELIELIHHTEQERQKLMQKLAASGVKLDPEAKMDDVWAKCPNRMQRDLLYRLHKTLSAEVEAVQDASANNGFLIRAALDAVSYKLNQLGGAVVEPAYGERGQEQVSHIRNFDLEA